MTNDLSITRAQNVAHAASPGHPVRRYWFESRKLSDPADLSWLANQPLLVEVRREDLEDRGLLPGEVGHFLAIYTELRLNGAHNISIAGLKMPIHLYGQRANHLFGSDADAMPDFITGYQQLCIFCWGRVHLFRIAPDDKLSEF